MIKHDVGTFHELRFIVYNEKYLAFDIECFPPASDNIRQHSALKSAVICMATLCFSGKH